MPRVPMRQQAPRPVQPKLDRYEPRFVNGIHTVFDKVNYGHGLPLRTFKEASRTADKLNRGELQWEA